jgi:hypothetical protein
MRTSFIMLVWLAGVAFGVTAVQKWHDPARRGKDQSRLNRVRCEVASVTIVDPLGNIVGCMTVRPGNVQTKQG